MAVARTVLLADGVAQQVREQAPWGFGWNTARSSLGNGTHTLQVQAQDVAGNVGSSSTVSVTVNNPAMDTPPPNVQFTSPANGSTLSGQAAFTVAATDEVAVAKVIVTLRPDDANYNNNSYDPGRNTRMYTLTTAPYTVTVILISGLINPSAGTRSRSRSAGRGGCRQAPDATTTPGQHRRAA